MYLNQLSVTNIKCFPTLSVPIPKEGVGGSWCVLLGENGTGKTTVLQAIALALVGGAAGQRLLEHPEAWVRGNAAEGRCMLAFQDRRAQSVTVELELTPGGNCALTGAEDEPEVVYRTEPLPTQLRKLAVRSKAYLFAGYGAFRAMERTTSEDPERLRPSDAFRTLFNERAGLQQLEDWLLRLDHLSQDSRAMEEQARKRVKERLEGIIEIINGLLPPDGGFRLGGVNARGVFFTDAQGIPLTLDQMSDGYRTMFALAVDLIRMVNIQTRHVPFSDLLKRDQDGFLYLDVEGIVLIDEVDIHLHPKWQREIGQYLRRSFPKVQFIVASHSPFVAQSATPGCLFVLRRNTASSDVSIDTTLPWLRGIPVEEILLSPAFGLETTRDTETERMLDEYTRLLALKERGTIGSAEEAELKTLTTRLQNVLVMEQAYAKDVWDQLRKGSKP